MPKPAAPQLTHLDERGAARMVDVGAKPITDREARAECVVRLAPATIDLLGSNRLPKGDALAVTRLAGIMAAKQTSNLIPLCHPLALNSVAVEIDLGPDSVVITATVRVSGRTGVEMEALTAASVAGLTLIDMVKAVDRSAEMEIRLLEKSGGRSGRWLRKK